MEIKKIVTIFVTTKGRFFDMAAGKKQGHPRLLPTITTTGMAELTMKYLQLIVRFGKVRILLVIRF